MKKYILLSLLLTFFASSYSQSVRIVLQTRLNYKYVEFDSIVIINTRTLDTLRKFYPDTILFSSTVGIDDYHASSGFGFETQYRNPYLHETEVTLNVTKPEMITISLNEISGRLCNSYTQFFNPGIYKLKISAMNEGFFLLNARSKTYSNSIKLVQTSVGAGNLIQLNSESETEFSLESHSMKSDDSDFFNIGDRLIVRSYYKNNDDASILYTTVNGYFVHYLTEEIPCDSIDFIGKWYILASMDLTSVYPVNDPSLRYQNEVNFISDSVFSTKKLQTQSSSSIWPSGSIGVTQYYKYKLFPKMITDYPFSIYSLSTIVGNITSYSESNTFAFHFRDCNTIFMIPIGISYNGSDILIRDPE